jgi:hypothetical protein
MVIKYKIITISLMLAAIGYFGQLAGQDMPHKVMSRECSDCHTESNWLNIHFDHNQTQFRLDGKHLLLDCGSCHQLADFLEVKSECVSCHLDIHQGKLSKNCGVCHTSLGWSVISAITAHANTSFPLQGAHARLDCKVCHIGEIQGEFSLLKSNCLDCHRSDFENAPIHGQIGASMRCEECHNLLSWQPANYAKHDQQYFPIYSGAHSGKWNTCGDCHQVAGDFTSFECIYCHEHTQSRMNSTHGEVSGYQWVSARCYSCHPRGSGG